MKGPPRRPGADDGRFPVRVRECLAGRGYGLLHLGLLRLGYLGRGDDGRSGQLWAALTKFVKAVAAKSIPSPDLWSDVTDR